MDEGDVKVGICRKNSFLKKSSRLWMMPLIIFLESERNRQKKKSKLSITKKKLMPISTMSSILSSEDFVNSINLSNTQLPES